MQLVGPLRSSNNGGPRSEVMPSNLEAAADRGKKHQRRARASTREERVRFPQRMWKMAVRRELPSRQSAHLIDISALCTITGHIRRRLRHRAQGCA